MSSRAVFGIEFQPPSKELSTTDANSDGLSGVAVRCALLDHQPPASAAIYGEKSKNRHIELLGTFPNPMRSRATLRYALPEKTNMSIVLYDVMGRQVRTVVEGQQKPGRKQIQIDGSGLSSGVYFLRLKADGQTKSQRLTVLR